MISVDYIRTMARYNRWQNASIYGAADTLGEAERNADRGAFFGSIRATLSHLLWADMVWMSRFDGGTGPGPEVGLDESPGWLVDWDDLKARRAALDDRIEDWAAAHPPLDADAVLTWHSGALGRDVKRPRALCIAHFFNHQTHHRGQVHAMLTSAGARPDPTDLFAMPGLD